MRGLRAAVGISALAIALFASVPARADDGAHASAQERYSAGRESYRQGLYGRALEELERAMALSPSPNTHLYIARTLRELGRWGEAAEAYRATVREATERGGKYGPTRDTAELELRDVEARLATAKPEPEPPAPAKESAPTPLPPLAAVPPTAQTSSPGPLTWVAGGVALAGAASFGVLYGLASSRYGYLEDHCRGARSTSCDDARSTGRTEETVAYIALGIAAAAAVVTVGSLVLSSPRKDAARVVMPWPLAF